MQDMADTMAAKAAVVQPKQQQQPPPPPPQKQPQLKIEDKTKDPKDHKVPPRYAPRSDAPWCLRHPSEKVKGFCPNHGPGTPLSKPHPGNIGSTSSRGGRAWRPRTSACRARGSASTT